jgi:hypothetical protein
MKKQKAWANEFSQSEVQLIEQLRQQPDMLARVQSILELTRNAHGPLKTADEVEGLLVRELRQLGNTSMAEWARQAEERVSNELQGLDASVRSRKKKR